MTVNRLAVVRALYGLVLLCSPGNVVERVAGERPGGKFGVARRVLGARQLVQAAALARNPTRERRLVVAGVDATHALTMVPFVLSPEHRRSGALSVLVAVLFAYLGVLGAREE